jgi:sugar lactone lactonase YvrE
MLSAFVVRDGVNRGSRRREFCAMSGLPSPRTLANGLVYPDGPRWWGGRLWISDIYGQRVVQCSPDGSVTTLLNTSVWPGGSGFLPDGSMLVALMQSGVILRLRDGEVSTYSDLSSFGDGGQFRGCILNDMVVEGEGNAYVDVYGLRPGGNDTGIVLVRPDGTASVVADGLSLANGMSITPDGRTLIVAELGAARLTAFEIRTDGTLHRRRVWASVPGSTPDGICLDAEGAVWFGSVRTWQFFRVAEGGEVLECLEVGKRALAPALGGPTRSTLYLMTAVATQEEVSKGCASGFVEVLQVDVPGTGWP